MHYLGRCVNSKLQNPKTILKIDYITTMVIRVYFEHIDAGLCNETLLMLSIRSDFDTKILYFGY